MGKSKTSTTAPPPPYLSFTAEQCILPLDQVHNDLKREAAFLEQALKASVAGRRTLQKAGVPVAKPPGYFGELLKTQEQIRRITKSEEKEKSDAKALAEARKQRELRKQGKKVQHEVLAARQKQRSEDLSKIAQLRKKRKASQSFTANDDNDDEFDVQVEDALETKSGPPTGAKHRKTSSNGNGRRKHKDEKFGFGGRKRGMKRNDSKSTDNFTFSHSKNKESFGKRSSKESFGNRKSKKSFVGKKGRK